ANGGIKCCHRLMCGEKRRGAKDFLLQLTVYARVDGTHYRIKRSIPRFEFTIDEIFTLFDGFIKPEFGRNGMIIRKDILNSFCHGLSEVNKTVFPSIGICPAKVSTGTRDTRSATFTLQFTAALNISNERKILCRLRGIRM